jgi:hypothetical protein
MTANGEIPETMMHRISELKHYKTGPSRNPYRVSEEKKRDQVEGRTLLDVLRRCLWQGSHVQPEICVDHLSHHDAVHGVRKPLLPGLSSIVGQGVRAAGTPIETAEETCFSRSGYD